MQRLADVELTPDEICDRTGLVYVDHSQRGWTRRRQGRGFSYRHSSGSVIIGSQRTRLESLAIPPAWTDVWICPRHDGHLLAVGRDDAGRLQYLYHPEFRAAAELMKYRRLGPFGLALEDLRRAVVGDLGHADAKQRMVAATVRLLDRGLLRVGSHEPEDPEDAVGATTLRAEHVTLNRESGVIQIEYTAKGGSPRHVQVKDRLLGNVIAEGLNAGADEVFAYEQNGVVQTVTAAQVNAYLLDRTGQAFTAKDFRTWGGTVAVARELAQAGTPCTDAEHDRSVLAAVDVAADELGNTREVARQSYMSPTVTQAHRSGYLHEIWSRTRRGKHASRAERTTTRVYATAERDRSF